MSIINTTLQRLTERTDWDRLDAAIKNGTAKKATDIPERDTCGESSSFMYRGKEVEVTEARMAGACGPSHFEFTITLFDAPLFSLDTDETLTFETRIGNPGTNLTSAIYIYDMNQDGIDDIAIGGVYFAGIAVDGVPNK